MEIFNDVLVLSSNGKDMYLGRASGCSKMSFTGRWINLSKDNRVIEAEFIGGDFLIVDDLEVGRMLYASRILMSLE